jgi:hypothetical protein
MRNPLRWCVAIAIFVGCVLPLAGATVVRTSGLPELVEESTRGVVSEVVEVRHDYDDRGLHSTFVKLRILDALYGDVPGPGEQLSIKVYGAPDPMPDGSRLYVDGTPHFRTGERYLLLLVDDTGWGFTSAVGLYQGAFLVDGADTATMTVRPLAARHALFGEADQWVGDASTSPEVRRALVDGRAPVPYGLLRSSIMNLWTSSGGRPWQSADATGSRP